jgi:hypothetical protein
MSDGDGGQMREEQGCDDVLLTEQLDRIVWLWDNCRPSGGGAGNRHGHGHGHGGTGTSQLAQAHGG